MGLVSVAQLSGPHFGHKRTLNAAICWAPVSSISAGQRGNGQVADRRDTVYRSEGWGSSPSERAQINGPFRSWEGLFAGAVAYSGGFGWWPRPGLIVGCGKMSGC